MFAPIIKLIEDNDTIVIFGHSFPDGDCYGSQIGLREVIKLNFPNKKVYAVGSGFRRFHSHIAEMDIVDDDVIKNALAIIVDGNDLSRMEDQRVCTAKSWGKIDHHVDTGFFTQGPQAVDEDANSCCQIIVRMIQKYHFKLNKPAAQALFLGMLTDTGRFQYVDDFIETFEEAAWLCEHGADPGPINKILNITYEPLLAFKGYVYSNYKKTRGGVIYIVLRKEILEKYGIPANKAGSMVNLLGNIDGYPVWAFFCENPNGTNHAEFRSVGPAVQPIAAHHGGGGHVHAAGVTLPSSEKKVIDQVVKELSEVSRAYLEEKHNVGK